VDGDKGKKSLTGLLAQHGNLPARFTVRTGKGLHLYFAWPTSVSLRNSAGKIGEGLDVRGEGGYVLAPGSVHPSGAIYSVAKGEAIPPAPAWLLQMAASPNLPPTTLPAPGARIGPGGRHKRLAHIIGRMLRDGMAPEAILAAALVENAAFSSPKAEDEVRELVADMVKRYPHTAPQGSSGFVLESLRELMTRPDLPTDWVWEGCLVAGTVSLVVAKPKVGKSTFARNLALAVARGEPFLGVATRQGGVVYLALEERPEEIRADFAALGVADGEEPIWIHAAPTPAEGMLALVELVRERKPRLVVIDPLFRLARVKDEKAYAETYAALGPLIDVARETSTHVLLLHHAPKGQKADAIDAPLGSTAFGGAVCTLVVLKRGESYRTIQTVQRVGEDLPETVLEFDPVRRRLSLGEVKSDADRRSSEMRILEFLRGANEPQTQAQIRDAVEGQTRAIRSALTALTNANKVAKSGDGTKGKPFLYEFPNSGSQHIPGTRKPESEKGAQARMDTGAIVVPENSGNTILVSENSEGREPEKTPLVPAEIEAPDREDLEL
jgi:hypothetical protein